MRCTRTLTKSVLSHRRTTSLARPHPTSCGFTLVEMLVAVTLVLLMMAMFAEIFQIAGGSIAKTRGLAENDQRSRTLQTIIKADLDKRSFRWVYPFAAGEVASAPEANIGNRQGYFYVSENNPNNALDDVLQFTVVSTITSRNKDESPYYGQALNLAGFTYPNQPDADDGQLNSNNTGLSTVAEVVYFVRNGNLYRRQLLVREPLAMAGSNEQPDDSTPNNPVGTNVFGPIVAAGPPQVPAYRYSTTGPFWNDFDYSAYYNETLVGPPPGVNTPTGANFLGTDAMANTSGSLLALNPNVLAGPYRRFGHHHRGLGLVAAEHAGRPKEFAANTVGAEFIGRFTLQECSDTDFRYPHNKTTAGNTPTSPTLALTLDLNNKTITGPVDDFSQGPRRGEDLLLSNVHAFDILIWDDNYGGFVNIGDPSLPATSDYYISTNPATTKRRNTSYGPRLPATATLSTTDDADNAVFDTWHPFLNIDGVTPVPDAPDEPPFRATTFRPDYSTAGTEPTKPDWEADRLYTSADIGTIVFPTVAAAPVGFPFYYRLISVDKPPKSSKAKGKGKGLLGVNRSGETEPIWPHAAELQIEDNALTWQAVDNRKPLKAVKLEIRFVDASTQQLRQLTIIHSLVD